MSSEKDTDMDDVKKQETTLSSWSWSWFAKLIERTGVVVEEVEVVGAPAALAEVADGAAAVEGDWLVDLVGWSVDYWLDWLMID